MKKVIPCVWEKLTQQIWFVQTYTFQRKAYFCDWHMFGSWKLSSWNVLSEKGI